MADYYNISQLIEICPGSPAQMSLSESGSPWANIPTAPSARCVHLTRKKIWLLLSRVYDSGFLMVFSLCSPTNAATGCVVQWPILPSARTSPLATPLMSTYVASNSGN